VFHRKNLVISETDKIKRLARPSLPIKYLSDMMVAVSLLLIKWLFEFEQLGVNHLDVANS
jgi:hypothetical protein